MADITNLFKATVKTVKARQKAQGVNIPKNDKSILGPSKYRSEFASKSKEVVASISKLKDFLLEHRDEYINAKGHVGANSKTNMTDLERDQIDSDTAKIMQKCSEAIKTLKADETQNKVLTQVKQHREAVFSLLEEYLKAICKIYSEQRAIRVKRVVDRKKISRLEPEMKKAKLHVNGLIVNTKVSEHGEDSSGTEKSEKKSESKIPSNPPVLDPPIVFMDEEEDLSPEEAQLFEQENQQLYQEMNSMIDEVKQIEGKVVEISRLQEIFTEKVLEQDKDIDRIADTVVGTTENIKEANEEIREAMKNNAGLRVWILFFLIVCSLSLLFLDWYNA